MTRIGWEPTGPLAKPTPKPKRRGHKDPVTPDVRLDVLNRDDWACVAPKVCDCLASDATTCAGRLTLDHVKDQPRMGKRAPSDRDHLATVCERHHLGTGWATAHRPELREYLRRVREQAA